MSDDDDTTVDNSTVSDDGNPMTGVVVTQSPVFRWFQPTVIVLVLVSGMLAVASITAAIGFLAPSVSRLTAASERASRERDALALKVDALQAQAVEQQQIRDCLQLYEQDVEEAKGVSQVALAELFAEAVDRTPAKTPEEQAAQLEDNRRLVAQLNAGNDPLRNALAALAEYRRSNPPPSQCPYVPPKP